MEQVAVYDEIRKTWAEELLHSHLPGETREWDDVDSLVSGFGSVTRTVALIQLDTPIEFNNVLHYPTFIFRSKDQMWLFTGFCELGKERASFVSLNLTDMIDGITEILQTNTITPENTAHLYANKKCLEMFRNYQLSARLKLN